MDTDRESNESESGGISEFDESNVLDRIETNVDDIAGYRSDVILQSISKGMIIISIEIFVHFPRT